ncbi:hypothetical protein AB0J52_18250 [Spirillospora sp. NPDC049652]
MTHTTGTATTGAVEAGAEGGLVLKDEQGSLYFVRDSFLETLRVKGEGLERLGGLLGAKGVEATAGGQGFQIVDHVRRDEIDVIAPQNPEEMMGQDPTIVTTIMCPWFC